MDRRPLIFNPDNDQPPEMKGLILRLKPEGFELRFWSGDQAELREGLARADYLLVERARIPGSLLEAATNLKLIQKCGRGVERIDVAAAERLGIPVCCTADANSAGTAEMAVMLMLAASRRLCEVHEAIREGRWAIKFEMRLSSHELTGKTVGILGPGNVGRRTARILAHGFGCRVLYNSRRRLSAEVEDELGMAYRPLEDLLRESDVVSVHLPLTPETHHLIDARALALMKPSAVLVNTARGPIVDERALVQALREGTIAGAGLDVFEKEPPDPDNPLLKMKNVVLSPHCGGSALETITRVFSRAFSNIQRVEQGEPLPEEDLVRP